MWVIADRLAVAERIGGHGFQHRSVRRAEEILWLTEQGVTAVLSLLEGQHNLAAYAEEGLTVLHEPVGDDADTAASVRHVFEAIAGALGDPHAVLLVHREIIDDTVAGILAGYLVHSGMVDDPIVATSVIQQILGRPLGPAARRLIPDTE